MIRKQNYVCRPLMEEEILEILAEDLETDLFSSDEEEYFEGV